jgi:heme-degrading monooxygenase HmoA
MATNHERETAMILTVFRARLRADANMAAVAAIGERMHAIATAMPGFVSYKDYTAEDGENVTVVEFDSEAEQLAWRNHAEHRDAQERGRREFFSEYQIQVCRVERAYRFNATEGRVEVC